MNFVLVASMADGVGGLVASADPKEYQRKSYSLKKNSNSGKQMQLREGDGGKRFLAGIKEQPSRALPDDPYAAVAIPQNIPDKWKAIAERE